MAAPLEQERAFRERHPDTAVPHHDDCERDPRCEGYECGACYSCQFDFGTPERLFLVPPRAFTERTEPLHLCWLCYSSKAGTAAEYPDQYPDINTLQHISYAANCILEAIGHAK